MINIIDLTPCRPLAIRDMETAPYRQPGISLLRGSGLEIGALHQPCPLPPGAAVRYVDAITPEYAREFFPEIDPASFVALDRIVELDREGLGYLADRSLDFVIMSHVVEHLANPVKAIQEAFRVLAVGGRLLIAVPDRDFTFDRHRLPTSFEHLWDDYEKGVTENSDHHYIDFLKSAAPHVFLETEEKIIGHIRYSRLRREHAHVWTSQSFREFLLRSLDRLGYRAGPLHESSGADNQFEYFGVWERQG